MSVLKDIFADEETLPNGIYVRRKVYWDDCEMQSWPIETPWLATINIGGWHYSSKGETTKEQAITKLLEYMQDQLKEHKKQLEWQKNRIKELTEYLENPNG